ncbi:MAG: 2-oxoglutarate oxidoreductase [Deltaproteobacteria bacterium]|nr:2-oxoglutarate oxidoreductase [Deltaproteobacteria bacterium]MBW1738439.1 2-oxoglutarate oxidoreductase [Deltaproteobacteria bacterium]MBW1911209.1 2-oxoglutarate oxidoreductase [Deltaproteobacteria bacterium]MBW2033377.1 2-oxoglutarate oxidoreductase [Deltaproteobacteria bacterium]MBW2115235.1 2-oxoglutarate oxidoreductase [Deltaproteobacteria bacterium]
MKQVFKRPEALIDVPFHFCPGCHHGIVHRLVAECIDRYGLREKTIGVASVGCSVFLYDYFYVDVVEAPHGRAAAVATGVKRACPESFVFTYQGDGDLAAIGTAEIIHAANRGELLTVVFVNNAVFGMTGGQMAPTTLAGQETTTTPSGRETVTNGFPIKMAELLSVLPGTTFVARAAVNNPKNLMRAKKLLRKAFEVQTNNQGFGFVEFLSACPTNWKMSPDQANKWVAEEMIPYFPLGIFKGETV